jgi:hypothetical protein
MGGEDKDSPTRPLSAMLVDVGLYGLGLPVGWIETFDDQHVSSSRCEHVLCGAAISGNLRPAKTGMTPQ